MRTLFAISMLCFFSLLGAVLALVRKVYQGQRLLERRERMLRARILAQDPVAAAASLRYARVEHTITGSVVRQYEEPAARSLPHQTVEDLAPQKAPDWRFMVHTAPGTRAEGETDFLAETRKRPQAAHFGAGERLDWAYFNKDLGDLSDPYEPPRATGTSASSSGTIKQRF